MRPAVLAGHSLGAMTIAAWGGRHPTAVRRRARAVAMINTVRGVGYALRAPRR